MSVYADACDMKEGTPFRNVNDSTGDPEIESKDWIELWEDRTELQRGRCCACGMPEKTIVGGHIVLGSGQSYGDASNGTAFLRGLLCIQKLHMEISKFVYEKIDGVLVVKYMIYIMKI